MANKSGIHIKKSHKGLFTAKAKKAGYGIQEYASHVLANKDNFDTETIRQAVFAKNATKFNHAQYGADNISGPSADQLAAGDQEANANFAADNNPVQNPSNVNFMKRRIATGQENPYLKNFNVLASTATGIGNIIQNHKLKNEEEAQLRDSLTPKFMQNMEQEGLDNGPAYYQYGGITADPATYGIQHNLDMGEQGVAHNSYYGKTSVYQNGGDVSSDKAKEILRDGTANGYPLTDKQRRYFGWVAGGRKAMGGYSPKYQAGGAPPAPAPAPVNDSNYRASATLQYYKEKLNDVLRQKNPQAYDTYFNNLSQLRRTGKQKDAMAFVQNADYNDYLSPEEVKKALGDKDYQKYLSSVKDVNSYNLTQGSQPLYGDVEGQNDPSQLNYGRRFASLTTNPTISITDADKNLNYTRNYAYNPQTGNVDFTETGDTNLRPQFVANAPKPRPRFQTGGKAYKVGDQLTLSRQELNDLRNQGYEFEIL